MCRFHAELAFGLMSAPLQGGTSPWYQRSRAVVALQVHVSPNAQLAQLPADSDCNLLQKGQAQAMLASLADCHSDSKSRLNLAKAFLTFPMR